MSSIDYFRLREPVHVGPCSIPCSELHAKLTYALKCWFVDVFKSHGTPRLVLGVDVEHLRNHKFSLPRLGIRAHAISSSANMDPVSRQWALTLACNISNILTGVIDEGFHDDRLYVPRSEWLRAQINVKSEVSWLEVLKAHLADDSRVEKVRNWWFFGRVSPEIGYFGPIWQKIWNESYAAQVKAYSHASTCEGMHRIWLGEICGATKEFESCSRERMQSLVEVIQKKTRLHNQEMRWIFHYAPLLHQDRSYNELGPGLAQAVNTLVRRAIFQGSEMSISNANWPLNASFIACLVGLPSVWFSSQSFNKKERALLVYGLLLAPEQLPVHGDRCNTLDQKICAVTNRLPKYIAYEKKILSVALSDFPTIIEEDESLITDVA